MNLWVNRVRQLLTLAVALFFFSCEEEISFLGFKNPNSKFENYTIEIPLESSVLWIDSVRTSNFYLANDVNRLLVGKYVDPEFGAITSTAVGHYFWANANKLPENAQLISAELHLAFDLYFYGPETASEQTFTVYPIESDLTGVGRRKFVNKTPVALAAEPIGTLTRTINPQLIRELYNPPSSSDTPQPDTLKIPLAEAFYGELWAAASAWSYSSDSTLSYYKPDTFLEKFKGLAIVPGESNSMMIGFSASPFSQIVLKYEAPTSSGSTTKGSLTLTFNSGLSYNHIVADYSGTPLEGIAYNTDFLPANEMRYLQSGMGIATKLSFDNFFAFTDTVGTNIIINDAQLVVEGVSQPESFRVPSHFILRTLEADNLFTKIPEVYTAGSADLALYNEYRGLLYIDLQDQIRGNTAFNNSDYGVATTNDNGGLAFFGFQSANGRYNGPTALFLQQLYRKRENPRWTEFAMVAAPSESGPAGLKSVDRAAFPADKIKLVVKYTKPTIVE